MHMSCFDAEFTCALCGAAFEDQHLSGVIPPGVQDTELRSYTVVDPWPYLLHTCPCCGFTDYDHCTKLGADDKERIRIFLGAYRGDSDPSAFAAWQRFEILARQYLIRSVPLWKVGYAYLRAAWMADDAAEDERAAAFRAEAIDCFVQALRGGDVPSNEIALTTYLVGELNRRIGRFDDALAWLQQVPQGTDRFEIVRAQQIDLARRGESCKVRLTGNASSGV